MKSNITLTIVHDRKGRAKGTDKEAQLDVRVIHQRNVLYIGTGIRVRRSEWVAGQVINRLDASTLNERLAIIYKKVGDEVNAAIQEGRTVDADEIRSRVFEVKEEYKPGDTLIDWISEQIPLLDISEGTRKHYWPLVDKLGDFGHMKRWQDVTVEHVYEFDAYLHQCKKMVNGYAVKAGKKEEKLGNAGIYNYHKCLKALLNRALRFGKIQSNPYDRLKGQFKRGDRENPEYLTEDEMTAIRKLELERGSVLDIARDVFVFQMFTGLAYSDAQAFNFKEYKKVGGVWKHIGTRMKTGVSYVSELLPPAVAVLEKYGGEVPKVGNADYNHRLKEVGRMAGIITPLHSHLARHTFATWMLSKGAKIENVSRMLGHTNIQQSLRYAKVLAQSVHEDYERARTGLR